MNTLAISQEFRLSSNFSGPFNFSIGGNFLHYETDENYYVSANTLTAFAHSTGTAGNGVGGGVSEAGQNQLSVCSIQVQWRFFKTQTPS